MLVSGRVYEMSWVFCFCQKNRCLGLGNGVLFHAPVETLGQGRNTFHTHPAIQKRKTYRPSNRQCFGGSNMFNFRVCTSTGQKMPSSKKRLFLFLGESFSVIYQKDFCWTSFLSTSDIMKSSLVPKTKDEICFFFPLNIFLTLRTIEPPIFWPLIFGKVQVFPNNKGELNFQSKTRGPIIWVPGTFSLGSHVGFQGWWWCHSPRLKTLAQCLSSRRPTTGGGVWWSPIETVFFCQR